MFSQIVFWCILLYIPVCWLKKRIEIAGKNLFKEIENLEKRPFCKLWGK